MISQRLIRMVTKRGFADLFWEDLIRLRKENDKVTHEEVYEMLEQEYEATYGQRRYSSYQSFRVRRDE